VKTPEEWINERGVSHHGVWCIPQGGISAIQRDAYRQGLLDAAEVACPWCVTNNQPNETDGLGGNMDTSVAHYNRVIEIYERWLAEPQEFAKDDDTFDKLARVLHEIEAASCVASCYLIDLKRHLDVQKEADRE